MSSLITLIDHLAYHLYRKETDMPKGFNLLCGIILNEMGRQVTQGDACSLSCKGSRCKRSDTEKDINTRWINS